MRRSTRGLTLLELVIGMAVTAMVGLSVAGLSSVLAGSYSQGEEYYRSVQSARIAMLRLQSEVRKAHLLTEVSTSQMMLWHEPVGGDGLINPSELTLITYHADEDNITQYRIVYPEWLDPLMRELLDTPIDLQGLLNQPSFWADVIRLNTFAQSTVLASGITDFSLSGDTSAPTTRLVTVHVTAGAGARGVHLRGSVATRGDRTDYLVYANSEWVLVYD